MKVSKSTQVILSSIGASIRTHRIGAKWSTLDLAKRAGVGRTMIDRIEAGDPEVAIGAYFEVKDLLDKLDGVVGSGWGFDSPPRYPLDPHDLAWIRFTGGGDR